MDARSRVAPSGDYVLLAPSGDCNQTIPHKSTNRIRCFTSLTVLLPTSGKLARGICEINKEKCLVLIVTLFKNIQEHPMKFKNIRGYSNGKIKFKNIQDFRRPVRTLIYIYIIQIMCVCVCVCVCVSVKYRRPNGWTDHDQIWHVYADRPGNGSYLKKWYHIWSGRVGSLGPFFEAGT